MIRIANGFFALLGSAVICLLLSPFALAADLQIDCAKPAGTIRPLHGVNCGPMNLGDTLDMSKFWREAAIPLARLHDCDWPSGKVADMHSIFPNLQADPSSPESYRFDETDEYIKSIKEVGSEIVFRLGESIEHTKKKRFVHPPADYEKWSDAAVGIVRHYNEGWADGFKREGDKPNIRYWEIWNEPENRPACWTGSDEDYYRLYATAVTKLKKHDGKLLVGGPAVGSVGKVIEGKFVPTDFVRGFVERCRDQKLPLDFFSWHTYSDKPEIYAAKGRAIRAWLDQHGFTKTEIHLNEWNHLPGNDWGPVTAGGQGEKRRKFYERQGGIEGAAYSAYALLDMQDSPIDQANFFKGDSGPFGLFSIYAEPNKTYYAFLAFRRLLETPNRVETTGALDGKNRLLAGLNKHKDELTIVYANYRHEDAKTWLKLDNIPWSGDSTAQIYLLDAANDLKLLRTETIAAGAAKIALDAPATGVVLVKVRKRIEDR